MVVFKQRTAPQSGRPRKGLDEAGRSNRITAELELLIAVTCRRAAENGLQERRNGATEVAQRVPASSVILSDALTWRNHRRYNKHDC